MEELEKAVEFFGKEVRLKEISNLHLRKVMENIREPSAYNDGSYNCDWLEYSEGSYDEQR